MTADQLLSDACEEISAGLQRGRPAECVGTSAVAEQWRSVSGAYVDGRFTTIDVRGGQASAGRIVLQDGLRYRAESGLRPGLAERLFGGDGDRANGAGPVPQPPEWMEIEALSGAFAALDAAVRDADPRITQVAINFIAADRHRAANRDGVGRVERRPLTYLAVQAVARDKGQVGRGLCVAGAQGQVDALDMAAHSRTAARRAVAAVGARPGPVGRYPVVVGGGRGIGMLHEACCHALEGDQILAGSIYADRFGQLIASPLLTLTDDATRPGAVGTFGFDDEGVDGQTTVMIQDGRLVGILTDRESAQRLGMPATGNGRCASLLEAPLPRVSNTCVTAGTTSPDEMIGDIRFGVYAEHLGAGEVVDATGEFVFQISSGYLIENGRLTAPIREATVAGNGADVLRDIDAVGNDVTESVGMCGKFDQFLPTAFVGPSLRVRSLSLGGVDW